MEYYTLFMTMIKLIESGIKADTAEYQKDAILITILTMCKQELKKLDEEFESQAEEYTVAQRHANCKDCFNYDHVTHICLSDVPCDKLEGN